MTLIDIQRFLKQELLLQGIPMELLEELPKRYGYNEGKLICVDLSHMMIEKFPNSLMLFPDLEEINLAWNYMSDIPEQIGNLKQLGKINLARNKLISLPKTFFNLMKLNVVNLKANKIKELPNINWEFGRSKHISFYQ